MESAELVLARSTICSAFAGVVLGAGTSIRQSEAIDRYGQGCTHKAYRSLPLSEITDDWERVPDAELERACVPHLDPLGFRYYIPALVLSILRNYDPSSLRVIGTISSLYPKERSWHCDLERYSLLNRAQKLGLAIFLTHLPNLVSLDYANATQVSRALRNYWSRVLERGQEPTEQAV
jgi:hypothetical protein